MNEYLVHVEYDEEHDETIIVAADTPDEAEQLALKQTTAARAKAGPTVSQVLGR